MSLDEISRNVIGLKKNLETVFANHEAYIWNEKKATNDTQLKPVKILNNQVRCNFLDTDEAAWNFSVIFYCLAVSVDRDRTGHKLTVGLFELK